MMKSYVQCRQLKTYKVSVLSSTAPGRCKTVSFYRILKLKTTAQSQFSNYRQTLNKTRISKLPRLNRKSGREHSFNALIRIPTRYEDLLDSTCSTIDTEISAVQSGDNVGKLSAPLFSHDFISLNTSEPRSKEKLTTQFR